MSRAPTPPVAPAPTPETARTTPAPTRETAARAALAPTRETAGDLDTVTSLALSLRGTPYRLGGADPAGFDCSGFTRYVYAAQGIDLPRVSAAQYQVGDVVPRSDIRPGDLVFFAIDGSGPSHVGLALDADRFIHAPSGRGVVRIDDLGAAYWALRFIGGRRVADDSPAP